MSSWRFLEVWKPFSNVLFSLAAVQQDWYAGLVVPAEEADQINALRIVTVRTEGYAVVPALKDVSDQEDREEEAGRKL